MINLYFGKPYGDWAVEMVQEFAINHDLSTDRAIFVVIQELLRAFSDRRDGHSFLDDRFGWTYKRLVYAPSITLKQKSVGGIKYSVMVLSEDFVTHEVTGDRLPLTDRALTIFGEDFEDSFGIEYLGYKYLGHQKLLNLKQLEFTYL